VNLRRNDSHNTQLIEEPYDDEDEDSDDGTVVSNTAPWRKGSICTFAQPFTCICCGDPRHLPLADAEQGSPSYRLITATAPASVRSSWPSPTSPSLVNLRECLS